MKMATKYFFIIATIMTTLNMNAEAQKATNGKKVLVAYFSLSGNTKAVANHIKELTGGDLFEIEVAKPYPSDYHTCTEVAKKEKEANARPELKTKVKNMEEYDIIFVGFPNWWGTMPMPILTFLESYKLEGKIVIPFCTHGGGGEQNCFKDFVKNTSKATNKKGFLSSGGMAGSARPQVEKWLREIGIIK
jgi:hypothetical protein